MTKRRKQRKPREKIVASEADLELVSGELLDGRELRDLDMGELQSLRKEAAAMNAEALAQKRKGWPLRDAFDDSWHAATLAFLRQIDMEIRRERAYRKKQFAFAFD